MCNDVVNNDRNLCCPHTIQIFMFCFLPVCKVVGFKSLSSKSSNKVDNYYLESSLLIFVTQKCIVIIRLLSSDAFGLLLQFQIDRHKPLTTTLFIVVYEVPSLSLCYTVISNKVDTRSLDISILSIVF